MKAIIIFLTILFSLSLFSQYPLKYRDIKDDIYPPFHYELLDTIDGNKLIFPDSLKHLKKNTNKLESYNLPDSLIESLKIHLLKKEFYLIDSIVKIKYE